MRTFIPVLCIAIVTLVTSVASADVPRTKYAVGTAMIYPMSFDGKGLAPSTFHSIAGLVPVSEKWSMILKGGMATPLTTFQPAPQFLIGATTRVTTGLYLGATGIYKYVPNWTGTPGDAHLVGVSVAPTAPLPSRIALAFPVGVAHNLTAKKWSFSIAFELAFQL